MSAYTSLAVPDPKLLGFGVSPHPLTTRHGLVLGGGTVYPELNFTLPPMLVNSGTWGEVRRHYEEIIAGASLRAAELDVPGVVIEFEMLPPMTENPAWGIEIVEVLVAGLEAAREKHGLKYVVRSTPNDTREMERPPKMRSGPLWEAMLEVFEGSAKAGAELLSIESVGGKEVHDDALVAGDLAGCLFALCVMGERDMRFLWTEIAKIADRTGAVAAGDTACGFANTAMVLAEQKMIPRSFAAVVRAISAVRSLVAYECGAKGPGKDCGYENVIVKAITGYPMAMEGKSATCAHLSPVGNVAAAAADTWSNESVSNVKLLGAMAPTSYLETLAYDCRLFNEALADGPEAARRLRDWMVRSDVKHDPQAIVLAPDTAVAIGQAIVAAPNPYRAGVAAGLTAVQAISKAYEEGSLKLAPREVVWLDQMAETLDALPGETERFIEMQMEEVDTTRFRPEDYLLA